MPFADEAALWTHLGNTTGALMRAALGLAGTETTPKLDEGLKAVALAGWLTAVPALIGQNRHPLPDTSEAAIRALAKEGLAKLRTARKRATAQTGAPRPFGRLAVRSTAQTGH